MAPNILLRSWPGQSPGMAPSGLGTVPLCMTEQFLIIHWDTGDYECLASFRIYPLLPILKQPREITALRLGNAWKAQQIASNLQLLQGPLPRPLSLLPLTGVSVAGIPIDQVSCGALRKWRQHQSSADISANLQQRKIGEYGDIPKDIWQIVHHPIKATHVQELHYKMIFNALPLAGRTKFFAGNDSCYACPGTPQSIGHFVSTCWVAQELWQVVRRLEAKIHQPTDWMTFTSHHLFGGVNLGDCPVLTERRFFLHRIALETLWLIYTKWIYEKNFPNTSSIKNFFQKRLYRALEVLKECSKFSSKTESLLVNLMS